MQPLLNRDLGVNRLKRQKENKQDLVEFKRHWKLKILSEKTEHLICCSLGFAECSVRYWRYSLALIVVFKILNDPSFEQLAFATIVAALSHWQLKRMNYLIYSWSSLRTWEYRRPYLYCSFHSLYFDYQRFRNFHQQLEVRYPATWMPGLIIWSR